MNKKILVTGGCGFLGSNLASAALASGYELTVFDNLSRFGSSINKNWLDSLGNFNFRYGDIRNPNDIKRVLEEIHPDVIFHLSGQVAMTTSISNPRLDFETNTLGTYNLLESIVTLKHDPIVIYSSTNKVYGDLEYLRIEESDKRYSAIDYPSGFDESLGLDFRSPYGCSKGAADQYMLDFHRIYGLRTLVFRHSSIFGGRQFSTYDQGWVGWFIQCALNTKTDPKFRFDISGSGKQVRDVLFADDLISCYFDAMNRCLRYGNAYNIGGGIGNSFSLLELFDTLEDKLGIKLNYNRLSPRASDQKFFVANTSKAKLDFSWVPKVGKQEAIDKMIKWVSNNV